MDLFYDLLNMCIKLYSVLDVTLRSKYLYILCNLVIE